MYLAYTMTALWAIFNVVVLTKSKLADHRADREGRSRESQGMEWLFLPFFSGIAFFFLAGMIGSAIISPLPTENVVLQRTPLASLNAAHETSGFFFLIVGSEGTHKVYEYYTFNADGSASSQTLPVDDNTRVAEDASLKDHAYLDVIEVRVAKSDSWRYKWGLDTPSTYNQFELPKGSVFNKYSIN